MCRGCKCRGGGGGCSGTGPDGHLSPSAGRVCVFKHLCIIITMVWGVSAMLLLGWGLGPCPPAPSRPSTGVNGWFTLEHASFTTRCTAG